MTFPEFHAIVAPLAAPVVLLEGTRDLPEPDAGRLTSFARWLAETFPHALFRTGNAPGSDSAFAAGVAAVDPSRLQFVLPYRGHRTSNLPADTCQVALSDLAPATVGLFYVRPGNPLQGGTGHTIRVCRDQGVPVALQADWIQWS